MSLTEKLSSIKSGIEALLNYANQKTEVSDATLGDAVRTLVDGYGGGGGGAKYKLLGSGTITNGQTAFITSIAPDPTKTKQIRCIIRTDSPPTSRITGFIGSGTQVNVASIGVLPNQRLSVSDIFLPDTSSDDIGVFVIHGIANYTPYAGVCYSRKLQNSNRWPIGDSLWALAGATWELYALEFD